MEYTIGTDEAVGRLMTIIKSYFLDHVGGQITTELLKIQIEPNLILICQAIYSVQKNKEN